MDLWWITDNFHGSADEEESLPQTKIRYLLMRAAIQLKLGLFHAADRSCTTVLRIDPFCALAHYRRYRLSVTTYRTPSLEHTIPNTGGSAASNLAHGLGFVSVLS